MDNISDVVSTLLLITTAADYLDLLDHEQVSGGFVQRSASSIGVGVKWLGLLGYLNAFQCEWHCHAVALQSSVRHCAATDRTNVQP